MLTKVGPFLESSICWFFSVELNCNRDPRDILLQMLSHGSTTFLMNNSAKQLGENETGSPRQPPIVCREGQFSRKIFLWGRGFTSTLSQKRWPKINHKD